MLLYHRICSIHKLLSSNQNIKDLDVHNMFNVRRMYLQFLRSAHLNQILWEPFLQDSETWRKFDCIWVWKLCTGQRQRQSSHPKGECRHDILILSKAALCLYIYIEHSNWHIWVHPLSIMLRLPVQRHLYFTS